MYCIINWCQVSLHSLWHHAVADLVGMCKALLNELLFAPCCMCGCRLAYFVGQRWLRTVSFLVGQLIAISWKMRRKNEYVKAALLSGDRFQFPCRLDGDLNAALECVAEKDATQVCACFGHHRLFGISFV